MASMASTALVQTKGLPQAGPTASFNRYAGVATGDLAPDSVTESVTRQLIVE